MANSFEVWWKEHGHAIQKGQWSHIGITQHHQHFEEPFDESNFEIIKTMAGKNKKKINYDLKVGEALEITRPTPISRVRDLHNYLIA